MLRQVSNEGAIPSVSRLQTALWNCSTRTIESISLPGGRFVYPSKMNIITVPWPLVAVAYASVLGICAHLLWHDRDSTIRKCLCLIVQRVHVNAPQLPYFNSVEFVPLLFFVQIRLLKFRHGLRVAGCQCRYRLRVFKLKLLMLKNKLLIRCLKPTDFSALLQNVCPRLPNRKGETANRDSKCADL